MALTENTYTGNGSTKLFSFTFPYLKQADVKVSLDGANTTAFTFANATQINFNTAPANGVAIRIYRSTPVDVIESTFYPGSSIRAQDLNDNFTQILYVSQESDFDATNSITVANTALNTANTALSTANAASTEAANATTVANSTIATANNALSTANTAITDSAAAVSTANSASSTANSAATDAATALSNSTTALSTANTADTNASNAVSTANTALSTANTALSTANTASTNASNAVSTANTADTNASQAVTTANNADIKADAAIAAITNSINYVPVANVASIPSNPNDDTFIEVTNTTGLEGFTPLTGLPVGFVGDAGLRARLRYTFNGNTWNWIDYKATDPDGRYIKQTAISGSTTSTSTTNVANSAAVKTAKDAADAAQTTADSALSTANTGVTNAAAAQSTANTANTTANAALPKAGGTMTGNITFNGSQTFPGVVTSVTGTSPISVSGTTTRTVSVGSASTSAAGVVQLVTATNSTSTTQAATPSAVKSAYDLAASKTSNTGTVTSVATSGALTGGTITTSGTLSVRNATTGQTGVVQLSTSTSSTSTSTAATSSAVKSVQDFVNSVSGTANSAQSTANSANSTANAALARSGGTMTGRVYHPAGSAGAPSITFDDNSGLYQPAGDQVGISTAGWERIRFLSNGTVQITGQRNGSAPEYPGSGNLRIVANGAGGCCLSTFDVQDYTPIQFVRDVGGSAAQVGTITCGVSNTSYNTSSDYRLKENVVPLTGAVDRVKQLKPRRFNFIVDPGHTVDGFLAHEAQDVVKECATGTKDEVDADGNPVYQGIDQSKLVPLLTAALQEAIARIEVLEANLNTP